ncbi:sigma-70 family RNA polymerase sigma factor, partial [Angustibacter aerolatus]
MTSTSTQTPEPVRTLHAVGSSDLTTAERAQADAVVQRVVAEHGQAMHRYAYRLCGDPHAAQDLVQEALLRVWRHAARMDERLGSVRGWLLTVLRNLDVDRRRAASARPGDAPVSESVAHGMDIVPDRASDQHLRSVENRLVVAELLEQLSEGDRDVLIGLYLRDQSVAQVADELGL